MTDIQNELRKTILAEPVKLFRQLCPDADRHNQQTVSELNTQLLTLKTQLKETQATCKKLSRQIGQAKKNNAPAEPLIADMQKKSTRVKNLKAEISEISERILSYFDSGPAAKKGPVLPPPRVHTGTESEISSIKLLNDEYKKWNDYIETNPAASIYHKAEWKNLITKVFGHECYYFYAQNNNGAVTGILPLIRLQSRLFGDFMVSMPYFNSGGAIANSIESEELLMQAANKLAAQLGVSHIEYRDDIRRESLPARTEKVNMILSLPESTEHLLDGFSSKLRSQIKRAQRETTETVSGGKEHLKDFYTVFARNMRDLGTPVYSQDFFNEILDAFPEQSKIIVIRMQNRPVAGAFLIGYHETLEIPWASTIKDVNSLSMNMLLYWEVLKLAVENGYKYFDFGRSTTDSGTFRFKQQWGAAPKQLYWHYWLPEAGELPKLNPDNPKYRLAINTWKKLPLFITRILGPSIVKNLP